MFQTQILTLEQISRVIQDIWYKEHKTQTFINNYTISMFQILRSSSQGSHTHVMMQVTSSQS